MREEAHAHTPEAQVPYIVEMRHITKRFPGIVANDDISLGIKEGEIFALLGENGAGKSTLMSMLYGLYEPDEGEILIRGEVVKIISPNHAAALNIGMVHQHFKLVQNYTITENIVLGIEPTKKWLGLFPYVDIAGTHEKIRTLSKNYGLEVDPTKTIEEINVSIQQRVEILKMLYREADILIFDEPTAVLTPQEITFLLQIIMSLRAAGKTIILITHKLAEVKQVADRCGVLNRGRLVGVYNVADISQQEMASLMVGREVELDKEKTKGTFGEVFLEVKNLTITNAEGFPVVKNASFTIRGGEVFAIAGVSGNGQVELADAIAGLTPAHSGEISFQGRDMTRASVQARTEAGISYIPEDRQHYGLVLDFSVADNLLLKNYQKPPFSKKGIFQDQARAQFADALIAEYDIRSGQGAQSIVRAMSGGNQQKVIVAREIELDADLLIFVQPTRGLDIGAIDSIHARILAERDKGKAILLVSLELEEIMACADTIGVIYNGEIVHISPAEMLSNEEVGAFMMGVKQVD